MKDYKNNKKDMKKDGRMGCAYPKMKIETSEAEKYDIKRIKEKPMNTQGYSQMAFKYDY